MKLFDFTDNIAPNSKICIYGATKAGVLLKKLVEHTRKDVKILCFLDTYERGILDNLEIVNILDAQKVIKQSDLIVIASRHCAEIEPLLFRMNVYNYTFLDVQRLASLDMFFSCFLDPVHFRDHLAGYDKEEYFEKCERASYIFEEEEDKYLFKNICMLRANDKEAKHNILEYTLKNITRIPYQYLEYINKEKIRTVIEGGMFDGSTGVSFLYHFKNLENLHGFEPFYDKFKNKAYDRILSNSHKVKINKRGLYDKKDTVCFKDFGSGSNISCDNPYLNLPLENVFFGSKLDITGMIETISIDEYVQENEIGKVDYIKLDVEGSELKTLDGAAQTIQECRPQMTICLYHSNEDMYQIPFYLMNNLKKYTFRLGHYSSTIYETVIYAIPDEIYLENLKKNA